MKQLVFTEGALVWHDVAEPVLASSTAALVRPVAVASCDLDRAVLDGRAPISGPYPYGHEFVARVVQVGEDVRDVAVDELVAVPFQISCGSCDRCAKGLAGNCSSVPARASYGLGLLGGLEWGGAMADLVVVPFADAMCMRVPDGVPAAALSSLSDNLPDAYRTVAPYPDADDVLVVGGGSIGLYAVQIAVALGKRATYVDTDLHRLTVAAAAGALPVEGPLERPQQPFPLVVHTSGDAQQLRQAIRSVDHGGTCVDTGIYFTPDVGMPLLEMYGRGLALVTGRAHARRDMPAVASLVSSGRLDPSLVTSSLASWEDAADALTSGTHKVVVTRDGGPAVSGEVQVTSGTGFIVRSAAAPGGDGCEAVVEMLAEVSGSATARLRAVLQDLRDDRLRALTLDAARVRRLDVAALRLLAREQARGELVGTRVVVANTSPAVERVFAAAGLGRLLDGAPARAAGAAGG